MSKKVLILLNMGGPNNLDEVEVFLHNMFNDKNIITVKSDLLRKMIAFFITSSRKNSAKKNYELLGGKSPIVDNTKRLVQSLQSKLNNDMYVTYAMRYTPPYASDILQALHKINVKDIVLFPLYPQYSTTTTKSSLEDFVNAIKLDDKEFNIEIVEEFFDNNDFCHIVANDIINTLNTNDASRFDLIFSAHSLPQKIVDKGDSYQKQVIEQVKIVSNILKQKNINFCDIKIAYQSKLGPVKWLEPSLEDTIKTNKNKNVIIYPISFIIDNSETDYELSIEYKHIANELKYENYLVCRCPNDSKEFVDFVEGIARRYI